MKRFFSLLALFSLTALPAFADGMIVVKNPIRRPRPGPIPVGMRSYDFAPLEVTYHHVNVTINGQLATTSVDQEFYNPNSQRLEGTYLFPVPKGAQISKFTMDIGGTQVAAELLSADKARQIYEDIVRQMRDPALLEYADRDVFKVRVFPIEPNSHKRITLSYAQVLQSDAGLVSYVYPLNTEKFSSKPVKNVSVKVALTSPRPLQTIYSPSHEVEIKRDGPNRATVGFESKDVRPDTDFALYFAPEKDEVGVSLLTSKPAGEDGYFLLLESPANDVKSKNVLPKDVTFVLDTSGSMAGPKLRQAKKALQFCIENLNDSDQFEIIRFSTEVEPLFDNLVPAGKSNRDRANDFVKDLKAIGATAIDDALHKALTLRAGGAGRPYVVVFLTDGQPTIGETGEDQIVAHVKQWNEGRTRVFCFGIGLDVNTHLLDKIAEETRAANQYVLPEEDIEVKVSSFFSKIKEPVLANPTLQFTGGIRASSLYPSPLPDLFKGEQLVVVGRYSGQGNSAVVIEGAVNGETKKFTQEVNFSADAGNDFIPRLWATRRVGYLLDEIRLHGENAELRDEVTDLARKYGIVTPYTAYLIVEDEARRGVPLTMQSLPSLSKDRAAHSFAAANWNVFKTETAGERAVAGANYGNALKSMNAPAGSWGFGGHGAAEANRALGISGAVVPMTAAPAAEPNVRLAQYSEQGQGQFVAGRNAFQNGNQWMDSQVQKQPNARRVRIQFNSAEYFTFAAQHPGALPWLALGQNVQFVLDDTVYDIYE
jgi:Ca-activated chloride channel family protein